MKRSNYSLYAKMKKSNYKFYVEVKMTSDLFKPDEYWAVVKSTNGKIVFTGETRKRKSALIETVNNLFPGVKILDKTL